MTSGMTGAGDSVESIATVNMLGSSLEGKKETNALLPLLLRAKRMLSLRVRPIGTICNRRSILYEILEQMMHDLRKKSSGSCAPEVDPSTIAKR
jgi:hypothetical protein